MFIALLQLERIIVKNGYAIVPKEWLIDFLKRAAFCTLTKREMS